jgi:hypothetical protein
MKHTKLALIVSIFLVCLPPAHSQLITSIGQLGTLDFSIDDLSTTAPHTQTSQGIEFNSSFALGATLGGLFTSPPKDWSAYELSDFGLVMNLTGTNSNIPFTVEFYDSSFAIANTFSGSTAGLSPTQTFAPLTLSLAGFGNMSSIIGVQFTWDGQDAINVLWSDVAIVPEPTTANLLLASILAGAIIIKLKRHRKA